MLFSYEGYPLFVQTMEYGKVVKLSNTKAITKGVKKIMKQTIDKQSIMGNRTKEYADENLQITTISDKLENLLLG